VLQLSKQELKYVAEGYVRKRYALIQVGAMVCILIFVIVGWQFATANFIWFIIGMLGLWLLIFEPLRHIEMKKEMRKLNESYRGEQFFSMDSGELRESAWSDNSLQEEILALYTKEYLDFKSMRKDAFKETY